MIHALHTASQGMIAQQLNIDTISHNLSNVNTTGFKKARAEFKDLLYTTIRKPTVDENDIPQPLSLQLGLGVRPSAIQTMFNPGNMMSTENPLDVAINGIGFFKIQVPGHDAPLFSKDGSFKINGEGTLVTSDGYLIIGADNLPPEATNISISQTGVISYDEPGQNQTTQAGQLELAKFINPAGLDKIGRNLYQSTASSGEAIDWDPTTDGSITIEQGFLETSNVQVVEEMINMITAQRAYEINSKVIQTSDDMLGLANNLKR
jgi:flagellar basal-body rod protein FlgG